MSKYKRYYYDSNVFSGSADLFRTAIKEYLFIEDSDDGSNQYVEGSTFVHTAGDGILKVYESPQLLFTTASAFESIFDSVSFAVSIQGDGAGIDNNEQWHAFVKGGNYNEVDYSGILNEGVHEVHNIRSNIPYDLLDAKISLSKFYETVETLEAGYKYRYYLQDFQNSRQEAADNFLVNPNLYLLAYAGQSTDYDYTLDDKSVNDFVYFGNYAFRSSSAKDSGAPGLNNLRFTAEYDYLPLETLESTTGTGAGLKYGDKYENMKNYLVDFIDSGPAAYNVGNTLIFNKKGIDETFDMAHSLARRVPYYIKIDLPFFGSGLINSASIASGFDNVMLCEIAKHFAHNPNLTTPADFVRVEEGSVLVEETDSVETYTRATDTSLSNIDLCSLLVEYSNSGFGPATLSAEESYIVGSADTLTNQKAALGNENFRFLNKIAADSMIEKLKTITDSTDIPPWLTRDDDFSIEKILNVKEQDSITDVVAFRVTKTDDFTGQKQHMIIQNQQPSTPADGISLTSAADSSWKFYDTQVVYDRSYTYEVYAYVVSAGLKYEYTDAVVSRVIDTLGSVPISGVDGTCIEFYSLASGDTTASPINTLALYDQNLSMKGETSVSSVRQPLSSVAEDAVGYGTTAQEIAKSDTNAYFADFRVTATPTFKIFEIPISSKSITIKDNPPPSLEVTPYQIKNDSQKIGFMTRLDSFVHTRYSEVFESTELSDKSVYLDSNNLLPTDNIKSNSVSKPRFVQIYKLSEMPSQLSDFRDSLVDTKDLAISGYSSQPDQYNNTVVSSVCFYEEMISTNKKHYYLFRYMNELGMPGPWSDIQVLELINDGGYKYLQVDTIGVDELGEPKQDSSPVTPYKKIIRLLPNIQHLTMNTDNVDFSDDAANQINNIVVGSGMDDMLWGKTFKLRLTSKKTGKKIDINVTYNLKREGV